MDPKATSEQLLAILSRLKDTEEFSDLTLSHNQGIFKVHRAVVCPQSEVIHKACTAGFEETFSGVIQMTDMPYTAVGRMVQFFYSLDYSINFEDSVTRAHITVPTAPPTTPSAESFATSTSDTCSTNQVHARMFALGDRFDIPGLRGVALQKYIDTCNTNKSMLDVLESVRDIYEGTPATVKELRFYVTKAVREQMPSLLEFEAIKEEYEKVLVELPDFARDLLAVFMEDASQAQPQSYGPSQSSSQFPNKRKHFG